MGVSAGIRGYILCRFRDIWRLCRYVFKRCDKADDRQVSGTVGEDMTLGMYTIVITILGICIGLRLGKVIKDINEIS